MPPRQPDLLREEKATGGKDAEDVEDAKEAEDGEGVDRMCRELSAIGTKEPQYHLVAFIMKATVSANLLEEGLETSQINSPTEQGNETSGQEKDKKRARKTISSD